MLDLMPTDSSSDFLTMSLHSPFLVTVPLIETDEGLPQEYAMVYPHLLIWTDRVDLWRLDEDSFDLIHVATLFVDVSTWRFGHKPFIDEERKLLVIPEHFPTSGPPKLRVFNLADGALIRKVHLYGSLANVPILYRNGHALTLIMEERSKDLPNGQTNIVLCDIAGDGWLVSGVNLPPDMAQREKYMHSSTAPLILEPMFFGSDGDVLATSTTQWLGKLDLLCWRGPQIKDDQQPDARLELQPVRPGTQSMVPGCYIDLGSNVCVLCTNEAVKYDVEPLDHMDLTSVKAIDVETMTVKWTAEPIWGEANHVQHVPTLGVILVFGTQDIHRGDITRVSIRDSTYVAVIDAKSGSLRMMDTIDSGVQGNYIVSISLSGQDLNSCLVTVWDSGEVNIIGFRQFMESGFERDGLRLQTTKVFPEHVVKADVTPRYIVAMAGAGKMRTQSDSSSYSVIAVEEATVLMADWSLGG
jgi:hypothetical protein